MEGKIVHVNIPSTNLAESQQFYSDIFGWTFTPNNERYVLFDDGGMGGGFSLDPNPLPVDGVLLFIQVNDLNEKLQQIEEAGCKIVLSKTPIGGPGFYGVFTDPQGNRMGLYSKD